MIKKFKKWWFNHTNIKCDYCKKPVDIYYDAYLFPVKDYKGDKICIECIGNIPLSEKEKIILI